MRSRPARPLHPFAWWVWAACLAVAASRSINPFVLLPLAAAVGLVVTARRSSSPWDRSYLLFLELAAVALVVRVVLFALLGTGPGTHVLFRLPTVPLPGWLAGVRLGGPVSLDGVLYAAYDGLRLGAVLLCIGAANSLTSPRRLVKSLPPALYEAGVALTVALSIAPQAAASVRRLRAARRLRGRDDRGLRAVTGLAVPVLEGALDGSVELAASMDARGFGRSDPARPGRARIAPYATTAGLVAALASTYALVAADAPRLLGAPLLGLGGLLLAAGLLLGRGSARTRYRPDPWRAAEWAVVGTGAAVLALVLTAPTGSLNPATSPPAWPDLPWPAFVAVVIAAMPAWLAPPVGPRHEPRARPAARAVPVRSS